PAKRGSCKARAGADAAASPVARWGPCSTCVLWQLYKATDPSIPEENWECIQRFCDQVNANPEGSSLAPRLLAHKIQSPQEMEALHALTVLEMCVNNCGERFHSEVAKFRFLNELIKVLSPKYFGSWSSEKVKSRVIEIMFSWTVWFPQEVKIRDAYQMLKKQGLVKQDPKLLEDKILPPPSPRPKNSIFDVDEEKSKLLARLLKSSHPEDLQAANRLIKSMIKEEQEKSAKVSKRLNTLDDVRESVRLLEELLVQYRQRDLSAPDLGRLQGLSEHCEKLRPLLFRLASETVDNDEALGKVQQNVMPAPSCSPVRRLPSGAFLSLGWDTGKKGHCAGGVVSILHAFSSRNLSPLKSSLPDLPCSSAADVLTSSLACDLKPAAALQDSSLANLFVPLASIKPSAIPPITVYDQNGFKAMLHFSRDPAPSQVNVLVMVLSLLSTSAQPIQDIVFQAAVPKVRSGLKVKLGCSEVPWCPLALAEGHRLQDLLLYEPLSLFQDPIRLRYKLMFTQGGRPVSEVGEVTGFPEAELWGRS
uniref:Golgi associated, gamma adaptin ear containing, ARF binding protein 2 n=1 Tax=Crocodylus porosus TaxID=8502 RepID=A0A7M4EVP3_CROPO